MIKQSRDDLDIFDNKPKFSNNNIKKYPMPPTGKTSSQNMILAHLYRNTKTPVENKWVNETFLQQ